MNEIILTLEGTDYSIKRKITELKAAQILSFLGSTETTGTSSPSNFTTSISRASSRRAGIRDEVRQLPIDTSMEGYPGYHELSTKTDKIIWILQYAEQNDIKGLSSGEVDYLSSEMKDRIEAKNFGAFNLRNIRSSYVKKIGGLFRAQQKGLTYLKNLGTYA